MAGGTYEIIATEVGETHNLDANTPLNNRPQQKNTFCYVILVYPSSSSLKLKPTSWLDGVRGVAAVAVFIFHTMNVWENLSPAYHADAHQNNILQLPFPRTFFVSGGTAVAIFFAISGYVLTQKSLRSIREGESELVYPAMCSSLFRRGFRLYIPPIFITFCDMLTTRFEYKPLLHDDFVAEATLGAQVWDWLRETDRFINPFFNLGDALRGHVVLPKYYVVVWTIPVEFYGSLVCYLLLLVFMIAPGNAWRMCFLCVFSAGCMSFSSWNMFCFTAGMLIADINLSQEESDVSTKHANGNRLATAWWSTVFALAFYISGFPSLKAEVAETMPMPGFETLLLITPLGLDIQDHARFWWSISGILMLLSISQLPSLKSLFETNLCQYLGKVSFSLYLVHAICILLFGGALQILLLERLHLEPYPSTGYVYWLMCGVWYILFTPVVFAIAAQFERAVDAPSVRFARWLEGMVWLFYEGWRESLSL